MGTPTIFLSSRPIISVGIPTDGTLFVTPLHSVTVVNESGTKKHLLVNYAFGAVDPKTGINFENEIGPTKKLLFDSIEGMTGKQYLVVLEGTPKRIESNIIESMHRAEPDSKILFLYERENGDDTPFYHAIGFDGKKESIGKPVTLADLGLTVAAPFIEVINQEGEHE